ncbi:MAG: DUF2971 domain-containing protein [Prevotella sp.]|nr:DUF2971 domain-containing protein [Alistipes senegalensis]MCM1357777.1 DUF2971 domain-containing protein [Prevotella sp.]MCM1474568.1 DUF2971 domain-containing protein [Muribaculaceae bacterium]
MSRFYICDEEHTKNEILKLNQVNFTNSSLHHMQSSIFKYFPFNDYSIQALTNNTIYLQTPALFDDPYDCNLFIDSQQFYMERVKYYAKCCGITLDDNWNYSDISYNLAMRIYTHISQGNPLENIYKPDEKSELVRKTQEIFINTIKCELLSPSANENSYHTAINKVIGKEYKGIQDTANRFRISCFTQNPFSMLMWSHYAQSHQGFCIEYQCPTWSDDNSDIYCNLFPVIYTDERINLNDEFLAFETNGTLTKTELWNIYKYGLLSKNIDWKYQQEWRLISYDNLLSSSNDYNCKFFKIKKVYLGNKMTKENRLKIVQICKDKDIPYSGVTIANNKFEMKECNMLCEDCLKLKSV